MASPDIDRLREALRYEPETGKLFWLERPLEHFKSEAASKTWNSRFAGKEALTTVTELGYLSGRFDARLVKAHRVCWAVHFSQWPDQIDHINGNRADNRLKNLRNVGYGENARNQKVHRNNTSGTMGVYWHKSRGCWQASISANGSRRHIGWFKDRADAVTARKAAERELEYHANHGRAA